MLPPRSQRPASPLCSAPGAGRGGFPLPDTTGGGLRGPQNAGNPRRAEGGWEKRGLQKWEQEAAAACCSHRVPHVQK